MTFDQPALHDAKSVEIACMPGMPASGAIPVSRCFAPDLNCNHEPERVVFHYIN